MYGGGEDRQADSDASIMLRERLEIMAESALGMFTPADVEVAMKASNFNKGLVFYRCDKRNQVFYRAVYYIGLL